MKNIDYLDSFFRKHHLSGKITVNYTSPVAVDENMTDIVFENGDVININDVIFDIDSEFPADVFDQWIEVKRNEDISLREWIQTNTCYIPKNIDTSSVEEYQKTLTSLIEEVKQNIDKVFQFNDDGSSEDENEESGDD